MTKTSKNESGIQQVIDMNTNGDISTGIKVDYLVDSVRGLKTMVAFLMLLCFIVTGCMVYIAVDNYRLHNSIEHTMDTINKRHYTVIREFTAKDK